MAAAFAVVGRFSLSGFFALETRPHDALRRLMAEGAGKWMAERQGKRALTEAGDWATKEEGGQTRVGLRQKTNLGERTTVGRGGLASLGCPVLCPGCPVQARCGRASLTSYVARPAQDPVTDRSVFTHCSGTRLWRLPAVKASA